MTWVGQLSYSIYLWHWPFIVFARLHAGLLGESLDTRSASLAALASVLVATLVYYLIEQPLRRRGAGRARRLWLTLGGVVLVLGMCFSTARLLRVGAPPDLLDRPEFAGRSYSAAAPLAASEVGVRYADVDMPPVTRTAKDQWRSGGVVHAWGEATPRVVLLGSSHALMYGKVLDEVCRELELSVAFLSVDATTVFFGAKSGNPDLFPDSRSIREFDDARRHWLAAWRPDVVVVAERWDGYGDDAERFRSQFLALMAELRPAAAKVVLFEQVPVLPVGEVVNLRDYAAWHASREGRLPTIRPDAGASRRATAHRVMAELARERTDLEIVPAEAAFLLPDGSVRWTEAGRSLYADDDHLSSAGAELLRADLSERIRRLTGK